LKWDLFQKRERGRVETPGTTADDVRNRAMSVTVRTNLQAPLFAQVPDCMVARIVGRLSNAFRSEAKGANNDQDCQIPHCSRVFID
jgi:hypothetical protein